MEAKINSSENEFENGSYIMVETPGKSFPRNRLETLVADQKNWQAFHFFLCIATFLLGIIVGSIFHDRLLNSNTSQPVWKSSNLMQPDSK